MRRMLVLCVLIGAALVFFRGAAGAQTPTATPYPTYTPYPTLTAPSPTAVPTLWQQTEKEIPWWLAVLAAFIFGGILTWLLRPLVTS
jgi:hypothetical protein